MSRPRRKHKNQLTLKEFQDLLAWILIRDLKELSDRPHDLYQLALEAAVTIFVDGRCSIGHRPLRYQLKYHKEHGCFDLVVPV